MLTQRVVMVLNCNVLCHLQQCKCPDQDLWAPLYTELENSFRLAKLAIGKLDALREEDGGEE